MKYTVHGLDVWGNRRDGFSVNDVYPSHATIELPDDATDKQIIQALKDIGDIRPNFRFASFDIEGEIGYGLYVTYAPENKPVYELRALCSN